MKLESEDEMNLENKLIELKEHVQYMQNMLAMGQTLMNIDHATLTDLFNDCQPAQKNSLDYAERELATLRAQNAELIKALESLTKRAEENPPAKFAVLYRDLQTARTLLAKYEVME